TQQAMSTTLAFRGRFNRHAMRLHATLAYLAACALLIWGLSGLLHPWITTFGAQAATFMPPQRPVQMAATAPLDRMLANAGIATLQNMRVVVGEHQNLLQITEDTHKPRRYFNLNTGEELPDHDAQQAAFLARHYLKLPSDTRSEVTRINAFTAEYPEVNRILPVYRVQFDRPDGLRAYIDTETSAITAVTDHTKQAAQQWFQWLHTWSWMPVQGESARVAAMATLVGALALLSLSGLVMLVLLRRRQSLTGARSVHRKAAYVLFLPVAALSLSGLLHLFTHGWPTHTSPLRMQTAKPGPADLAALHTQWERITQGIDVQGLSLVYLPASGPSPGQWLYRLATPMQPGQAITTPSAMRNARFDGVAPTGPAVYLRAQDGQVWPNGDREYALRLGQHFTGLSDQTLQGTRLITRFGGDYDFRNKRLPVWQLDYGAPLHASVFVDTATGALVDTKPHSSRAETWTFSMLHKWNFLQPLGRNTQNIALVTAVLLAMILMAGIGLAMRKNRKSPPKLLRRSNTVA
ncbi:MAG TPA: hypothetical protein VFV39_05380, partial [Limnobacter sp.]|nr:hypothetical protein [Limnobacter sp.]